ncbi:hypothetical protein Bbelb_122520 [Branchiostoma belcheri]|nr:hypothetical protein Bbelb_122520 [Branchiostoma belcheri]
MADVHGDLYASLGLTPTASRDEILDAYKKEIIMYEEASKNSRKSSAFKEADAKYRSVSRAFSVLSDASRRQSYDNSHTIPETPKATRQALRRTAEYHVKENEQSITVFLPKNLAKSWLESCQEHHDTLATNGGKNGYQIKTSFVDVKTGLAFGTVSVKVYESTQKLLIQGSAYLLWFSEVFPVLKEKISNAAQHAPPATVTTDEVLTPKSTDSSDVRSLCSTCGQPLTSEVCTTCTTVPKVLFDENSNETGEDVSEVMFDEDNKESRERVPDNKKDLCSSSDLSVLQDSVNKLETCLVSSISDRKSAESSMLQRMNALENTMKTQMCIDLSSTDKKKLQDEIAQLTKAKNELQKQVDSLQLKFEELASVVDRAQTTVSLKSTETQTSIESSERSEKLLRELATISVQNRYQVLENDNEVFNMDTGTDTSNTSARRHDQSAKPGTKKTARMANANNNLQDKTTETRSQRNKDLPPDVLILGDSNTKGIKMDVLYPNKSAKREVMYTITEATEHVQQSTMPDPKVLLFHVGTNDARETRDATSVTDRYRKLIHTAHEKYPRTQLVLSSIPPRDDPVLQQIGDSVNSWMKDICEEIQYVHVIDNNNLADMGSIKPRLYNDDGYHLNRFGLRVLAANIKRTVNPMIGLGQYVSRAARPNQPSIHNRPESSRPPRTHNQGRRDGQGRDPTAFMSSHSPTYEREFPTLDQARVTGLFPKRNCPDKRREQFSRVQRTFTKPRSASVWKSQRVLGPFGTDRTTDNGARTSACTSTRPAETACGTLGKPTRPAETASGTLGKPSPVQPASYTVGIPATSCPGIRPAYANELSLALASCHDVFTNDDEINKDGFTDIPSNYVSNRQFVDKAPPNKFGRLLTDLCIQADLRILNGRVPGDLQDRRVASLQERN